MFEWLWAEHLWFPEIQNVTWADLENRPGSDVYYPKVWDLHWSLVLGAVLLVARYFTSRFLFVPLGYRIGVPRKKTHGLEAAPALEKVYLQNTPLTEKTVLMLSKDTDMSRRQVLVWFRKRKQNDATQPIKKFAENGWQLLFYSLSSIGGFIVLWDTPWFADTAHALIGLPHSVSRGVYWYYMLETSFYWCLVFTLCYDHRRKDFRQLVLHHLITLLLVYFSWMMDMVRIGTLILLTHDVSDPFLVLTKMIQQSKVGDPYITISFVVFVIVWTASRLYFFPFVILHCITIRAEEIGFTEKIYVALAFMSTMLYTLMLLNIVWSYMIAKILVNKLLKDENKDIRSDTDTSEEQGDTTTSRPVQNGNA